MNTLRKCYEAIVPMLGEPTEPYSVVETVESYRHYWRPNPVRVILLAESHVFTKAQEHTSRMKVLDAAYADIPPSFVRFVYCPAYGENQALEVPVDRNSGTWQYWKIFASCMHSIDRSEGFPRVFKGAEPDFDKRIHNKLNLLKELKENGVWLVDASVVALYGRPGGKPHPKTIDKVIRTCWTIHISRIIAEADPRHIIIIGKNVGKIVKGLLSLKDGLSTNLPQPQIRLSANEHHDILRAYYDITQKYISSKNDKLPTVTVQLGSRVLPIKTDPAFHHRVRRAAELVNRWLKQAWPGEISPLNSALDAAEIGAKAFCEASGTNPAGGFISCVLFYSRKVQMQNPKFDELSIRLATALSIAYDFLTIEDENR